MSMDDEQIAARRAEIPVHCAACGGEFPGITVLHNGVCDECQKLTHGPNYRLVAALQRKDEQMLRLKDAMETQRFRAEQAEAKVDRLLVAIEYVESLEAEIERLREALQRILDHGQTHDEPCWALHNGDCADVFQEIARAALNG